MKNVYVLITRAQTATSALIHLATGDLYTHVSLAYDDSLESLCSFARLYYPLPFPGGLIREEIRKGHFSHFKNVHCVLLSLPVTDEVHRNIKNCVQAMVRDRGSYRYSYLGAAFCRAGIATRRRSKRYFCSQFVAEILLQQGAVSLPKLPCLMRPQDFLKMPQFRLLYQGAGRPGILCAGTKGKKRKPY